MPSKIEQVKNIVKNLQAINDEEIFDIFKDKKLKIEELSLQKHNDNFRQLTTLKIRQDFLRSLLKIFIDIGNYYIEKNHTDIKDDFLKSANGLYQYIKSKDGGTIYDYVDELLIYSIFFAPAWGRILRNEYLERL